MRIIRSQVIQLWMCFGPPLPEHSQSHQKWTLCWGYHHRFWGNRDPRRDQRRDEGPKSSGPKPRSIQFNRRDNSLCIVLHRGGLKREQIWFALTNATLNDGSDHQDFHPVRSPSWIASPLLIKNYELFAYYKSVAQTCITAVCLRAIEREKRPKYGSQEELPLTAFS